MRSIEVEPASEEKHLRCYAFRTVDGEKSTLMLINVQHKIKYVAKVENEEFETLNR